MKYLSFAILIGVCLTLATANAIDDSKAPIEHSFGLPTEELDDELQFAKDALNSLKDLSQSFQISIDLMEIDGLDEETSEIEPRGAFSGLYWVTKRALRTLKGVHCTIMYALTIRDAAQQFIDDVNACGGVVSKQVQAVIDTCNDIITTVNNILNLNEKVCNNGDYNEGTDGGKKTGWKCFWNLLKQFMNLKKQIQKVLSQLKKIPTTGADASECVNNAATKLSQVFTEYPSYVKTCSKLSKN